MGRPGAFSDRYGHWAVVAGASEGLGAAFAHALAEHRMSLVLIARRQTALDARAAELKARWGAEVRTIACDLADTSFADHLARETTGLDVGFAVFNASYSVVAPMFDRPLEDALRAVDVNVRGPLLFAHALVPGMISRGRGALVLMSSLAGSQGSPQLAVYAATKAFNTILGESLWAELAPHGIDVVVSCAGAIRTQAYAKALKKEAPGTLDPADVVDQTLAALGRGPIVIPGGVNKFASFVLRRLAPRAMAIGVMGKSVSGLK
jgi:short-subunit dehydrogenase